MNAIRDRQLKYIRRYDQLEQPPKYEVGQSVMIRGRLLNTPKGRPASFTPKWFGPYNIQEVFSGRVYQVDRGGKPVRVHANDVRPAPPRRERTPTPPASPESLGADDPEGSDDPDRIPLGDHPPADPLPDDPDKDIPP